MTPHLPLAIDLSTQQQSQLEINLQHAQSPTKDTTKMLAGIMPTSPVVFLYWKFFLLSLVLPYSLFKITGFGVLPVKSLLWNKIQ